MKGGRKYERGNSFNKPCNSNHQLDNGDPAVQGF